MYWKVTEVHLKVVTIMVNKVFASGIWYTISNFLIRSIGLITTPIFTRLLTKSEFGDFNNFTTWIGILMIVTSLNLGASMLSARRDYKDDWDAYVFSMMSLSLISTLIWLIIFVLFSDFFVSFLAIEQKYIYAMFLYLLFYPIIDLFQTAERFQYKYKITVLTSLLISVGSAALSVFLVVNMGDRLQGRIIGFVVPTIIGGIILGGVYLWKAHKINWHYWIYALPITLPFIPHLLSLLLLGGMSRVMIKQLCSSEDLAMYSLAYTIGSLVSILVMSINNAYSPWLGDKLTEMKYEIIRNMSFPYAAIFSFCGCVGVLLMPEFLLLMGGKPYMGALYVMPPVAAGCIMQFLYCMYVNVEQYKKKTIGMACASVIAAVINFILNYIFIPKFGFIAAAYTTYIGYLSLLLMHMWLVHHIHMSHVYENKKILLAALATSVIIFMENMVLDQLWVRYILLITSGGLALGILYKYKNLIMGIVKK